MKKEYAMLKLKKLLCLILFSLLIFGLSAQSGELNTALINTAVSHLDNIMSGCLEKLELIAQSPEAKAGDWQGIKAYLGMAAEELPGVYFYVLPDGNYYSLEKDFTNLNLSNRGYFESLFAGNNVLGYDIYSRSSGKQSALMAAPIFVDGRVAGALGASVFLDELRTRLNSEMDLPETYTWFVLNQNGLTMLDRELEYIFLNPLELGSESMKTALGYAMLGSEVGELTYEMGSNQRRALHKKLPNLNWWFFIASKERITSQAQQRLNLSLETIVPALQSSLDRIDSLARSAVELKRQASITESGTRELLQEILSSSSQIVQAAYVNPEGLMQYIEPSDYRNYEGTDISAQEHVMQLRQTKQAVLSKAFMTVEGFQAISLAIPVYDDRNTFQGSVSILLRPELLLRPLLTRYEIPQDYEFTIMQTDGMIIYEEDEQELGKNLFTDPVFSGYDSIQELGHRISTAPLGEGDYSFLTSGHELSVVKIASWNSVNIYGREWRVIISKPVE